MTFKTRDDLCEYVREYIAFKYQELTMSGFLIEVDIPEERFEFEFDHIQMNRVFENIISNAVKYNKEGTTLYCYVRINDGIIIEMGDDGIGTFFNIEFSRLD